MRIATALIALLEQADLANQEAAAARLRSCGMDKVTQPKISKWRLGKARLTLEQMNQIEECLEVPRGWILARAGYVDVVGLLKAKSAGVGTAPAGREQVDAGIEFHERELQALRRIRRAIAPAVAQPPRRR